MSFSQLISVVISKIDEGKRDLALIILKKLVNSLCQCSIKNVMSEGNCVLPDEVEEYDRQDNAVSFPKGYRGVCFNKIRICPNEIFIDSDENVGILEYNDVNEEYSSSVAGGILRFIFLLVTTRY
jgi:hypothetical protein